MRIVHRMDGDIYKVVVDENDTLTEVASVLPITITELVKEMNDRISEYEMNKRIEKENN